MKNSLLFFSVVILFNGTVFADSSLQLKPAKCVTLKQGNTCYQELKLSWQADINGHYCVYNSNRKEPIHCWNNVSKGEYSFEFKGMQSINFQLFKMPKNIPLAKQHFSVKWVYKARPNSRWRLF